MEDGEKQQGSGRGDDDDDDDNALQGMPGLARWVAATCVALTLCTRVRGGGRGMCMHTSNTLLPSSVHSVLLLQDLAF